MKRALLRRARDLAGRYAERGPLRSAVLAYYRALLADVRRSLSALDGVESIFYRSRVDYPQFRPGLSDVDVLIVVRPDCVVSPRAEELQRAIHRLMSRWLLLQSVCPVTAGEAAERSSMECLPYRILSDYGVLAGGPSFPDATRGSERQERLSAAMLGSWYLLVYLPRWLFEGDTAANTNYRKIFYKALVFLGVNHDDASSIVSAALVELDPHHDLRAAARRAGKLESIFARVAERSAEALDRTIGSLAASGDPGERGLPVVRLADDERARTAEKELERELSRSGELRVLLCGSADGPASYCLFIHRLEGSWDYESTASIREWWNGAREDLRRVTPMLEPVIARPILALRSNLPAILTLDISRKLYCLAHGLLPDIVTQDPRIDGLALELEARQLLTSNYRFQLRRASVFRTVLLYRIPTLVLLLRGTPVRFGDDLHSQLKEDHPDLWRPVEALRALLPGQEDLRGHDTAEARLHTDELLDLLSKCFSRGKR